MIDPMTAYMLAQAGKKVYDAGSRLFQPKFGQTRYGSQLNKIKQQGIYGPAQRSNMLTQAGRQFDVAAAPGIQQTKGRLYQNNMYNSIAAVKTLNQPNIDKGRMMGDTESNMLAANEEARRKARLEYAQAADQDQTERRKAVTDIGGAAIDMGMQYLGNKAAERKATDDAYAKAYAETGIAPTAITLPGSGNQSWVQTKPAHMKKEIFDKLDEQQKIAWWESLDATSQKYFLPIIQGWEGQ